MRRELARELAKLLYGPTVRMHGNGRFERQLHGVWKMSDFKMDRYEVLDDRSASDALAGIRAITGNGLMADDAYDVVTGLRDDGDDQR